MPAFWLYENMEWSSADPEEFLLSEHVYDG